MRTWFLIFVGAVGLGIWAIASAAVADRPPRDGGYLSTNSSGSTMWSGREPPRIDFGAGSEDYLSTSSPEEFTLGENLAKATYTDGGVWVIRILKADRVQCIAP